MHCGEFWEKSNVCCCFSCVCGIGVILMDAFVERYSAFSVVSVADPILLLGFLCLFCGCCLSVFFCFVFCFVLFFCCCCCFWFFVGLMNALLSGVGSGRQQQGLEPYTFTAPPPPPPLLFCPPPPPPPPPPHTPPPHIPGVQRTLVLRDLLH